MPFPRDPFDRFDVVGAPAIVAAVSGGSDSTAMLLLLKRHVDRMGGRTKVTAVTIDHVLRHDSATEARAAAAFAASLGVAHRTVAWDGEKPSTGLAAAARTARYRLLSTEAARVGASIVVTGHTADDQAETVSMRAARGQGRGMAGMAPATLHDGRTWILRPLLTTRRDALRATLRDNGVTWCDDPTNENTAYERVRVRASLGRSADVMTLVEAAERAGRDRADLGRRAATLIAEQATRPAHGLIKLAPEFARQDDKEAATYALRILLAATGGVAQLTDEARASALVARLCGGRFRVTLSRSVIEHRADGTYLLRERRGLPQPCQARNDAIWDGRWRLSGPDGAMAVGVAPDDPQQTPPGICVAETAALPVRLIRAGLGTRPRFHVAEASDASGWKAEPVLAPWSQFLPSFDLAPACAVATLFGAAQPPSPPFAEQIW